jgi:hypothetical protein
MGPTVMTLARYYALRDVKTDLRRGFEERAVAHLLAVLD